MKSKQGISLIILTITIIILAITTALVVFRSTNVIGMAEKSAFQEEMQTILEYSESYYLNQGELPIVDGVNYTKEQIINMASTEENALLLEQEFVLNNDNSTNFYEIDFDKLNISSTMLGKKESTGDVYILNESCTQIYYPEGYEIDEEYYFSLSSRLDNKVNLGNDDTIIDSNIDIQNSSAAISVVKSTDKKTDALTLTVNTTIQGTEKLYYTLGGVTTEITTLPSEIILTSSALTDNQKSLLTTDSTIYFEKRSDDTVVAKVSLDIGNLKIQ